MNCRTVLYETKNAQEAQEAAREARQALEDPIWEAFFELSAEMHAQQAARQAQEDVILEAFAALAEELPIGNEIRLLMSRRSREGSGDESIEYHEFFRPPRARS